MSIRNFDLRKINSATKYPSILTFHELGERGRLKDNLNVTFDGPAIVTEKLDGTNSRMVFFSAGDYIIGSREELLHARGDLIHNPALGIVGAIKSIADKIADSVDLSRHEIVTVYGETYGGKTSASKAYGSSVGFRIFDVVAMPFAHPDRGTGVRHEIDFAGVMNMEIEAISRWRDGGGQTFLDESEIAKYAVMGGVEVTPRLKTVDFLPTGLQETHDWLKSLLPGSTNAPLEGELKGKPEGVVVRTTDRSKIAKIRFEDYERTLR